MPLESFAAHELTPPLAQEVEAFLDSQDTAHPFQFPGWADPGSKVFLLRHGGRICWAGTFGIYAPFGRKCPWIRAAAALRGPVCDDVNLWQTAAEQLIESFRTQRICYLEVSPDRLRQDENDPGALSDSRWQIASGQRASLRLDLTRDEDTIFGGFRKSSRYEVRRAERMGVEASAASTEDEIDAFLRLYQELAERKGFAQDEVNRMRRQIRWLMNSGSRGALLVARAENAICGGVVIARAARRGWYVWGATSREKNVGHLLQWRALQWARQNHCTEYDFGGYTPGATSGPAWFKAGFGGRVVHFVPPRRKILQPVRYRIFSLLSRAG